MKKTLTCLILVATMLVSAFALTGCSYNWESGAVSAVTLDLSAITGKTLTAKKVDDVDAAYVDEAIHTLLLTMTSDKTARPAEDKLAATDVVKVSATVKQSLLFYKTAALYTTSSDISVDLNAEAPADTALVNASSNYLDLMILKDLKARVGAGEEIKVGDTVSFDMLAVVKGSEKKDSSGNVTGVESVKVLTPYKDATDMNALDTATITVTVEYKVNSSKITAKDVKVSGNDTITLYFVRTANGESDYSHNVKYDFSNFKQTGAMTYDPQKNAGDISAAFAAEIYANGYLNDSGKRVSSGTVFTGKEFVKVSVSATYDNGEETDSTIKIADISTKTLAFDLGTTDDVLAELVRADLVSHLTSEDEEERNKVKLDGKFEFTYEMWIDKDNKAYKSENTFYTALDNPETGDAKVEKREVTVTYSISDAYAVEYQTATVTEDVDGAATEVTYEYYVASVKGVPAALTMDDLTDSAKANASKDAYDVARNFYVVVTDETDDDGNATGNKIYMNNYYGETLFIVEEDESGNKSYYTKNDDGDKTAVKFKLDETKTVVTEEDAIRYAIEAYLVKYEEETKKSEGIKAIWKTLSEAATIEYPQELLDAYYDEYIQNMEYEFYVTNKGATSETTGEKDSAGNAIVNKITSFNAYLAKKLSVASEDKIREAIDEKAKAEVKDRLLLYKVADLCGIKMTDEEYSNAMNNVNAQWQYNNYMYSYYYNYYYAMLGDMIANVNFGYTWYDTVDDYITALYGSVDGINAGILFDKVLETIYEDEDNAYNVTVAYTEVEETK